MHQMNTSRLIIKFMVSLRSHSSHCFKLHMLLIKTGWLNPQPVMLLGLRPQRLQHIRSSLLQHLRGLQGRSVPPHGPVRSYLCWADSYIETSDLQDKSNHQDSSGMDWGGFFRTVLDLPNGKSSKMAQAWRPTHHPSWTMCGSALTLFNP